MEIYRCFKIFCPRTGHSVYTNWVASKTFPYTWEVLGSNLRLKTQCSYDIPLWFLSAPAGKSCYLLITLKLCGHSLDSHWLWTVQANVLSQWCPCEKLYFPQYIWYRVSFLTSICKQQKLRDPALNDLGGSANHKLPLYYASSCVLQWIWTIRLFSQADSFLH